MSNPELANSIEALLFALGRPMDKKELAQKLSASTSQVEDALQDLATHTAGRGVVLVDDGRAVELRTGAHASELVERVRRDEYARDIGRAGLEALAAIVYRGPLTRAEIDFIRGVSSSQTLRTLAMRGLVRKVLNPKDERSFLYEPTLELLAQLGVTRKSDLPEFDAVRQKLTELEAAYHEKEDAT